MVKMNTAITNKKNTGNGNANGFCMRIDIISDSRYEEKLNI